MIRSEIEKKSIKKDKNKQISIKRMRIKLKKINDTFIFWQGKERKKKREEKKNVYWSQTIIVVHTHDTNKKRTAWRFQCYTQRQCLEMGWCYMRHLKGAYIVDSLARSSHEPTTFLIIFILIKRSNCPFSNLLITTTKNQYEKKKRSIDVNLIFFLLLNMI